MRIMIIEFIVAFFYLQPSLVITYLPIYVILLSFFLNRYKGIFFVTALLCSLCATLLAFLSIMLIGIFIIAWTRMSIIDLTRFSFAEYFLMIFISALLYWIFTDWYLRFMIKVKKSWKIIGLSSTLAGLSVIAVYYLLWQ